MTRPSTTTTSTATMREHDHPTLRPADMAGAAPDAAEEDFMQTAVDLEAKFYDAGYAAGHAHGRLHGLFEGRQLGLEKAWEVWEEVGFYEGFTAVCERRVGAGAGASRKDAKTLQHIRTLRELIGQFPTSNPTPAGSGTAAADAADGADGAPAAGAAEDDGPDLAALLSQIRARYRLLCASVGARPRLVAASKDGTDGALASAGVVEGIEGPMKGVDTRQLRF